MTWGKIVKTASYLHRYKVTKALPAGTTPHEARFNKKPDVSHLWEVGCKAFVLVQNQHVTKIEPKSIETIFVSYDTQSKTYRCWHKQLKKIIVSRNVQFVESHELIPTPLKPGRSYGSLLNPTEEHPEGWTDAPVRLQEGVAAPPPTAPASSSAALPNTSKMSKSEACPTAALPMNAKAPPPESTPPPAPEGCAKRAARAPVRANEGDPQRQKMLDEIHAGKARVRECRATQKPAFADTFQDMERDPSQLVDDVLGALMDLQDEMVPIDQLFGEMLEVHLVDFTALLGLDDKLTMTSKQALSGEERKKWCAALVEEFAAIKGMGVYRLIQHRDVPAGRHILKGKVVFQRKTNGLGVVVRWKA
jgi:hypothetical protein